MTHLDELGLSARAYNALVSDPDYISVEAVRNASDQQLMRIPNFGKVSLAEVRKAIRHWKGAPIVNHDHDPRRLELVQRLRQLADLLEDIAVRPYVAPNGNGSNHDPS